MEYYSVLGVNPDASGEEIRRAYRRLARQWHPDKWTGSPSLLGEANQKFQRIQEAYSVLSDTNKRTLYDAGLYDDDDDEDEVEVCNRAGNCLNIRVARKETVEGFADFVQEMVTLMNDSKKQGKSYSMEELQSMFWEMARDFEMPAWEDPHPLQQAPTEQRWFCGVGNSWGESMIQNKSGGFYTHHFCR